MKHRAQHQLFKQPIQFQEKKGNISFALIIWKEIYPWGANRQYIEKEKFTI